MKAFQFALRMLRRDARAGELHLLVAALIVAVSALTSVGFFTDRVRQALELEANQLMGADMLLTSDRPWSDRIVGLVRDRGLALAETRTFPSMVLIEKTDGVQAQLSEIKAVTGNYPLRGSLRTAAARNQPDGPARGIPPPGSVWIDERLASALSASAGDRLVLGERTVRVDAILTLEPDRGINFFSVAPRVLMNIADLDSTGLVQTGSRVNYRLLASGNQQEIKDLKSVINNLLERGQRLEDAANARPEIRTALERTQRFLGLSALLTVILSAVSVALASRRYMQRHLDPCAIMRCLGATQNRLMQIHLGQFFLIGLFSSLLGCGLGYLAHFALHAWLANLLATPLPAPGTLPVIQGLAIGVTLLFGFSLPPLLQLRQVSTLRVLRREFSSGGFPPSRLWASYGLGFSVLAVMMFWIAGDFRLGSYVLAGFSFAMMVFALIARIFVRLASHFRGRGKESGLPGAAGWRYGLASLERRSAASVVQIVALSLGFMALLLLTVTRNDLMTAWRQAVPPGVANRFVVNIQPEQLTSVRRLFAEEGLDAEFAPMVRGRLVRVNGKVVGSSDYEDERARRLIEREFNLSFRQDLPKGNAVLSGRWFSSEDLGKDMASVEEGLAKTLGLVTGDRLEFVVAGQTIRLEILSLRKLNWDSMRVNFFVLTQPASLEPYPASWITSFHLPQGHDEFVNRLIREHPNLTVIDVAAILKQLQSIIDQVARAIQFIFLFTLAAGLIVLYAALASAAEERRYELAVMRALGARRSQLRHGLLVEFAAIGGLSGLIASFGSIGVGQILAEKVFQFQVAVDLMLPLLATGAGALAVTLAGGFAVSRLMRVPPLEALRSGAW